MILAPLLLLAACNGGVGDRTDGKPDSLDTAPDTDGGPPVDCPDLGARPAAAVPTVEACEDFTVSSDPWNIVMEWSYASGVGGGPSSITAVGHLTDDDGDGVVGSRGDRPELIYADYSHGRLDQELIVLAGDGSGVVWRTRGLARYRGVAIADVNGDDSNEVLAFGLDDTVLAYDASGVLLWRSAPFDLPREAQSSVADLDGDGLPEVLAGSAVLNGKDGSTVASWSSDSSAMAGDLDLDGYAEIVLGSDVYDHTGKLLWSAAINSYSVVAALVQGDEDPEGEIVFLGDEGYYLYDSDGTELVAPLPDASARTYAGPPCVADFDGDGTPELAVASYDRMSVLELDGSLVWSKVTRDSGPTGCSGFDLDGDGAFEVLLQDLLAIYVLDGRTGDERWSWRPGTSIRGAGGSSYPYVADVDNDGVGEIIAGTSNGSIEGVVVFGQAHGDWPAAGPTWGVHDYSETNLGDDGSVPVHPTPAWEHGLFRSAFSRDKRADLLVDIVNVCVADCALGAVELSVQVTNQGVVDAAAGTVLEIRALEEGGERVVTKVVLPVVAAGTRMEAFIVSLGITDVGALGFAAEVDPAGTRRDCDETNNRDEWLEVFCP